MTDPQTYTKDDGTVLLELSPDWRSANNGRLLVKLPIVSAHDSVVIPTAELLAMIDRAEPDAMRAYLRETAPEVIADVYRPAPAAADHFDYLDPEIPEADSPEDIDERVPAREALLTDAQERRLYLIEQLTKTLPTEETPALAHWIITGGMDTIEDLTLAGEEIGR